MPWSKCTLKDALTSTAGVFVPYEKQPSFKNENPAKYEENILKGAVGSTNLVDDFSCILCY